MATPKLIIRRNVTTVANFDFVTPPVQIEETEMNDNAPSDCCAELRKEIEVLKLKNEFQAKEIAECHTKVQRLLNENNTLKQKFADSEISLDGFRGNDEKTTFFFLDCHHLQQWSHY